MVALKIIRDKLAGLLLPAASSPSLSLHECLKKEEFSIDAFTYDDLLLDDFYNKYNYTRTSFGDELLNHWLREIKDEEALKQLKEDTVLLSGSESTKDTGNLLGRIGKQKRGHIITDLWNGLQIKSRIVDKIFLILSLNLFFSTALCIVLTAFLPIWIGLFLLINLSIFILTNNQIAQVSGSINYILLGLLFVKKLDKKKLHCLTPKLPEYKKFNRLFWCTLLFKDGFAGPESENLISILFDYLRIFLCLEALSFRITRKYIDDNIEELREIIYFVGYYDCVRNNTRILEMNTAVYAELNRKNRIDFEEMYHPLLAYPVKQTKTLRKGLVVTGLNMAGKSTFMRTIGLNQLLATSLGIAFADSYTTSLLSIVSSFRINDRMLEQKSRYFAEAERLSQIIKKVQRGNTLCLVDEILSGTNSKDRIFGATEILKELSEIKTSIVIAATHDTEIAENLINKYDLGYFDGSFKDKQLRFDYTLKKGIVSDRNGLLILKAVGIGVETVVEDRHSSSPPFPESGIGE